MKTYREIVVISGKGGTGKTSITASILPFLPNTVIADCDVDAPDLHILLKPMPSSSQNFSGMKKASIDADLCLECGICIDACRFDALKMNISGPEVSLSRCEGCGACIIACKNMCKDETAISLKPATTGALFESQTSYGTMIHAQLVPGEEASGKLITAVRRRAQERAEKNGASYILIDGPPGVACNAISASSGVDLALIVTEPGLSAYHDLLRLLEITRAFRIPTAIVINKSRDDDEHENIIRRKADELGIPILMTVPLDSRIPDSINRRQIPSLGCTEVFDHVQLTSLLNHIRHPEHNEEEEEHAG
jgi:MinD superfamily P-loop ATPase